MKQKEKDKFLQSAKSHIAKVDKRIKEKIINLHKGVEKDKEEYKRISEIERLAHGRLIEFKEKKIEELTVLHGSPYFVRCDIILDRTKEKKTYYFAKFLLDEEFIYSWVSPIASVRFEKPGKISYTCPDGRTKYGTLIRKDQYMIVGGKIVFLTNEEINRARELIYQEHFSSRKKGFVLPEIVAQMEKAQDQVIRAHHVGPFVISGPAGSGKTTLALHRVGYLMQSPETISSYPSNRVIVFVQDTGTKKYFSHLLPELGIENVLITTFYEWTSGIIGLKGYAYAERLGNTEKEKDIYEFRKMKALKNAKIPNYAENIFSFLHNIYKEYFKKNNTKLFEYQKNKRLLDRFDLTILLKSYIKKFGSINITYMSYKSMPNGTVKRIYKKEPLKYSLIVADEFQNYLSEQIEVLKTCIDEKYKSIIYVGDTAQQTQFGTIKSLEELHKIIPNERRVILQKVYRNTKNILKYIEKVGYEIIIPKEIRKGDEVIEKILKTKQDEIKYVKDIISKNCNLSIGILAKNKEYLEEFKKSIKNTEKVHIFSMRESQGVEFDIVCIVGVHKNMFDINYEDTPKELITEKKHIQKDLLYVALTRAMHELHVVGKVKLSDIFNN